MQKKQSMILNANTIGMLFMNLVIAHIRQQMTCDRCNTIAQTQKPWQRCDRELHVNLLEVVVDNGQTPLDKRLEHTLVQ